MRILIIGDAYLPSTISCAKLIHDLAMELHRLGHEPVVVTCGEKTLSDIEITVENGIEVVRIHTGKIKNAPLWFRGVKEARLSRTIWKKGCKFFEKNPCDLIIYYSPPIFFGSLVKRLKKRFACPSYLILRDIFPQWAVDAGIIKQGMIYWFLKFKERHNYEAADIIGVQSPANLRFFQEQHLDQKYNLEVFYNWSALVEEDIPSNNYRLHLGLENKVVFFYGGNIGVAQDMDNIIRLAENLKHDETAFFLLVGDGSEVPRLQVEIASKNLNNIAIHPAVEQREYLSMLSEFDVGLISLDRDLRTQNFPGKMLGYMYHSMPILASINPGNDLKDMLEENHAGIVCSNGEDQRLVENARLLLEDEHLRHEIGCNARNLLESDFSVWRAANQILSHFTSGNEVSNG
jgi:O26-antigen biosynthesis N-acetyl-L-fucosamine transferase